jgi:hypothetical protein
MVARWNFIGNGMRRLWRQCLLAFAQLGRTYGKEGIRFFMLDANPQDARTALIAEAETFKIFLPILMDDTQEIAKSLIISRVGELLLIETKT